jgi:hypothetical protein
MPLPRSAAMLDRAQTAGVASGCIWWGERALIAAVVPVTGARPDTTFLRARDAAGRAGPPEGRPVRRRCCPTEQRADLGRRPHHRQQTTLSGLVGQGARRARAGRGSDRGWRWRRRWRRRPGCVVLLHPVAVPSSSNAVPALLGGLAILLGVVAFFVRRGGRGGGAVAARHGIGREGVRLAIGSPTESLRPRRGTQRYEQADEVGHRPTEMAPGTRAGRVRRHRLERQPRAGSWQRRIPSARRSTPVRARSGAIACSNGWAEGGMAELLHGGAARRGGIPPRLRRSSACARRSRATGRRWSSSSTRRSSGRRWFIRTSSPVFDFRQGRRRVSSLAQEYIIGRDVGKVLNRHMEKFGPPA